MKRKVYLAAAMLVTLGVAVVGANEPAKQEDQKVDAAPAAAEAMLEEWEGLRPPVIDADKRSDPEYAKTYAAEQNRVMQRRAEIARAFFDRFPTHKRAGGLLLERWMYMGRTEPQQVMKEAKEVADRKPEVPARVDARFVIVALNMMNMAGGNPTQGNELAEAFIKEFPNDSRSPMILGQLAETAKDPAEQQALRDRLAREYPDSHPARAAKGAARQADAVGKPFELSFTDAITGKRVSMDDYKGKLVLIDFWATWCGPCVAQVPELKRLYETYRKDGLEIIGVSLDRSEAEGGLRDLKAFVEKNGVTWPQYYQGKHWAGEFSSSWGIRMVPTVFIVGRDGRLITPRAGYPLEDAVKLYLGEK